MRLIWLALRSLLFLSVLTLYFLYNSLLYIAYDEEAARVAGVKVDFINYIFAILMAAAVSISIKIVGVLVLSAMIALPVASALQLEKDLEQLYYAPLDLVYSPWLLAYSDLTTLT